MYADSEKEKDDWIGAIGRAIVRCSSTSEVSTPDTTFLMYADSEKEKDDWIGAIGRAIVRCSSTYTNEDGMDDEERDSDESN
mmetsp:Transcript_22579/g.58660  ORF Transcript_22579/g.58660 Transcript_22579/m.58660 type:complete len:82 (+) Transcript_22579:586-831(+)